MSCMYFQYDKEKAHVTENSVWVLQLLSMTICIGLCQSYFHDLNMRDFHLWEKLKLKAYRNNVHICEVLHTEIGDVMVEITQGKLFVSHNFLQQ